MELKRLLTRANALLLQGAYQGAESFIEQAMAEADKLKSELAELDTMRTRVTEMAAEVERLQSAIDEANAQEPVIRVRDGRVVDFNPNYDGDVSNGEFFARPIPAQQSPAILNGVYENKCSCGSFFFGVKNQPFCAKCYDEKLRAQQSPAVAVPDTFKCWWAMCEAEMEMTGEKISDDSPVLTFMGSGASCHVTAGDIRKMVSSNTQPRITEQDAREIIDDYNGK